MRVGHLLPFALGIVLGACDDATPKLRAVVATAVPSSFAAIPATPDNPSLRIDRPRPLVPHDQRLKPKRLGKQVVIDSEGKWLPSCAIHRKCKVTAKALPTCTTVKDAESWETMALRAEHFTDPRVVVKGRLVLAKGAFSTGASCRPDGACCNRRRAGFLLEGPPSDLELDRPACVGDESRLCCSILAEGQEVIATGELRYDRGNGSLAQASLCRVAD